MNNKYYEKCDEDILRESEEFIEEYYNSPKKKDYFYYKKSIKLSTRIMNSLISSHKEFDNRIKEELGVFEESNNDEKVFIAIEKFNSKKILLVLDKRAHDILNKLNAIKYTF